MFDFRLQVAALTVLLAWAGLVRGIGEDLAMDMLVACQGRCIKAYDDCCTKSPIKWRVCHDLFVWCDNYCKLKFNKGTGG